MVHVQNQHEQKYVETIITRVHPLLQVASSPVVPWFMNQTNVNRNGDDHVGTPLLLCWRICSSMVHESNKHGQKWK